VIDSRGYLLRHEADVIVQLLGSDRDWQWADRPTRNYCIKVTNKKFKERTIWLRFWFDIGPPVVPVPACPVVVEAVC
jgi:hypothetical protein